MATVTRSDEPDHGLDRRDREDRPDRDADELDLRDRRDGDLEDCAARDDGDRDDRAADDRDADDRDDGRPADPDQQLEAEEDEEQELEGDTEADQEELAGIAVAEETDETTTYVHSPQFAARFLAYLVAFVVLAAAARVLERMFEGLNVDLIEGTSDLPVSLAPAAQAFVITVAVLVVAVGVGTGVAKRVPRFACVVLAAAVAAFAATIAGLSLAVDERFTTPRAGMVLGASAAAMAVLIVATDELKPIVLRVARVALLPGAVLVGAWTRMPVAAELLGLVGGAAVGAGVAFAGGTPSRSPSAGAVARGLRRAGLTIEELAPSDVDARASVPWLVKTVTGSRVFVKTQTSEERSADLLFRVWRALRLRKPGDARPESSLRRAVEHEAFVATRASAVGVRAPRLIAVGRLGPDGVFAAYQAVDGSTFEEVGEALPPAALRSAWSMLQAMHRSGIAHRDLRAANLLLDHDGDVWIVDFGVAEVAASDRQLRVDVVELLASTATLVGADRAVAAAVEVLGPNVVGDALPLLQSAALSVATRKAIGKDGLAALQRAAIERIHLPEPDQPHLERIRVKTVLTILALGVALWVLLPQVARSSDLWGRITDAQLGWVAVAMVASVITYLATAISLIGACPGEVSFLPAVAAQVASSFTNRISPANVGGMALNARFLTRDGTPTGTAVAAVGLSSLAGAIAHAVLTLFAVAWAGSAGFGGFSMPETKTLVITGLIFVGVIALGFAIPHTRRLLRGRVRAQAKQSWHDMGEVARQPLKLVMLFVGSAALTSANVVALYAGLRAFGVEPAFATVAVVYLAGAVVGSAAPTPSGLGALEAAVVAGLTATGTPESGAVAGVLLFRLATFWIPIIPGWMCFAWLQRANRI